MPTDEQARHYREAARDRGCTCPDLMAPFAHLLDCPLYEKEPFHQHYEASPAADVPAPRPQNGRSPADGARPVSSENEVETKPREAGKDSPSLGAGDVWEREEDHAEERHAGR